MITIGMIVPPADGAVPPEPPVLYPELRFVARGLALPELTMDGYNSVIAHVANLAKQLKTEGADAISLMGTSLSFYRGPDGNAQVLDAMRSATELPVTTMTDSVLAALAAFDAGRIAVATAYTDTVNDRLRSYLGTEGLDILSLEALNLTDVQKIQSVGDDDLIALGKRAASAASGAEALFISCGGLRTLSVIQPLEQSLGIPVISSATAGAWGAARLSGHSGRASGFGQLFEV